MIRKTIMFAGLAAALSLPVAAQAGTTPITFVRDGTTYVYAVAQHKGFQVLTGTAGSIPFELVVRGNEVVGSFDGAPIAFPMSDVRRTSAVVEIAQR
ncbi:hypothetical protein SPAN111604_04640 [Sphingomonas antarctica]|uniref:hypothetical protein n=1 Tax=Sphingomonas antarctica TaxID=2040274 RepID=UPI0039ED5D3A